jgi:hypothetical protein
MARGKISAEEAGEKQVAARLQKKKPAAKARRGAKAL